MNRTGANRLWVFLLAAALAYGGLGGKTHAETYPSRPVRIVVGFGAGGPDTIARIIAQAFTGQMGQSFIVESRPGAATQIGTEAVFRAAADGYTLLLLSTPFSTNHALFGKLPYETTDFRAIVQMVTVPTASRTKSSTAWDGLWPGNGRLLP